MDPILVSLLAGTAFAVAAYAVWRLVAELGGAETVYRDRPPKGFRYLWPAVNIFANTFGFLLRGEREAALLAKLRKAGQEYALTPQQFFGGKIVGLLVGAVAGMALAGDGTLLLGGVLGGLFGYAYPSIWLSDHTKKRNLAILKAMPFFLDIVTLSIESGLNLTGALQKAVDKCKPGPLMVEINRVLRDVRAGKPRLEALRDLADRMSYAPISSLVSALVQGELMGSSLGPILRAQSDQRRTERFQRAEKLAMEAPVKMLGPLIMFIFPCTFAVIGFPIAIKFMASGL
ncbi:type II secretion system F family protein [Ideonella azotifigens]|uniref:Type II secretion system protein GspF domain-containing protein n=1 Tax=Ideonella azotifigens TaxID=513160 RepID=A0ABN1JNY0_9BURK|nr:type II secretion system F family protein [Ideonella azotifigens]MCD2340008.1 type II secretion system F family protein [Ideonella azotifigens]